MNALAKAMRKSKRLLYLAAGLIFFVIFVGFIRSQENCALPISPVSVKLFVCLREEFRRIYSKDGDKEELILGFCPAMEIFAVEIAGNNPGVKIQMFPNSAVVLENLRSGKIDGGITGRKAKEGEISLLIKERIIKGGWTLTAPFTREIDCSELKKKVVHTYLDSGKVDEFLPEQIAVVFHETKEDAFRNGVGGIILADWEDVPGDYELLIPSKDGRKVPRFRAPFLYAENPEIF